MLVLSRKENERIVFPGLGISVNVLRVQGRMVRLGVDAPSDIRVLRHELSENLEAAAPAPAKASPDATGEHRSFSDHELRNRINSANLALHLAQLQVEKGDSERASQTLTKALKELASLDRMIPTMPMEIAEPEEQSEPRKRQVRVLLVEDEPHERALLADILRMNGYQVDVVANGEEALSYLESHRRPHVVLLDMHMPVMDGAETLAAIRANPQWDGLKVCAVSGADREDMGIEVDERGINRWFSKPFDLRAFLQNLDQEITTVKA